MSVTSPVTGRVTGIVASGVTRAIGHRTRVEPVFSPLSLFANDEVGVWYDPSDLSTLFQDDAGLTPVTADGQTVGRMLDKSGNAKHISQADIAKRPAYKTDGTLHWLAFDAVDDVFATGLSLTSQRVGFAMSYQNTARTALMLASELENLSPWVGVAQSGSTSVDITHPTMVVSNSLHINNILSTYANRGEFWTGLNAANRVVWDFTQSSANWDNLIVGTYTSGGLYAPEKIYAYVARIGQFTEDEQNNLDGYLSAKAGS